MRCMLLPDNILLEVDPSRRFAARNIWDCRMRRALCDMGGAKQVHCALSDVVLVVYRLGIVVPDPIKIEVTRSANWVARTCARQLLRPPLARWFR